MVSTRTRRGQQPASEGIDSTARKRSASPGGGGVASPIADKEQSPHNKRVRLEDAVDPDFMEVDEKPAPAKKGRAAAKGKEQSAINKKTQRSSDAKTSDVVVPAERRSTRTRAPPKDPYVDGLVAEIDAKKSIPKKEPVPKRSGGRKKKLSAAQLWSPQNVVTEDSPLVKADLKKLINAQTLTRENLGDEGYDSLIALLPADWIVYPAQDDLTKPDGKPIIDPAVFEGPFMAEAIRNYQYDLENGRYEPEYLAKAEEARRRRIEGEFDSWKEAQFELQWGSKQKMYHGAVAAESAKIRLKEMITTNQFKIGDIFSVRRTFIGTDEIRKDAVLTGMDKAKGTLDFRYPPGSAEWTRAGVADLTVEGVASLNALENLLLKEDGRAPIKIPNGNAWKTVRIIRKGEDLGCVFDLRVKYYHQHYSKD